MVKKGFDQLEDLKLISQMDMVTTHFMKCPLLQLIKINLHSHLSLNRNYIHGNHLNVAYHGNIKIIIS